MKRVKIIDGIRDMIAKNCPVTREECDRLITLWENGGKPSQPQEHGVFGVIEAVMGDVERASQQELDGQS